MTSLHARSTPPAAGSGAVGGGETTATTTWTAETVSSAGGAEHRPPHHHPRTAAAPPTSPRLAPLTTPGVGAAPVMMGGVGSGGSPPRTDQQQHLLQQPQPQRGGHHHRQQKQQTHLGGRSPQPRRPPVRLRCAASFGPFRPRALACRAALPVTSRSLQDSSAAVDDDSEGDGDDGGGTHRGRLRRRRRRRRPSATAEEKKEGNGPSDGGVGAMYYSSSSSGCVAAVSGPSGVAVFHTASPHRPYLVLDHASPASRRASSLAFRPPPPQGREVMDGGSGGGVLLAAGGGNGILIWDASGRALSPLLTRLTCSDGAGGAGGRGDDRTSSSSSIPTATAPPSPGAVPASQILPPSSVSGGNNGTGNIGSKISGSNNNLAPPSAAAPAPPPNPASPPPSWDEVTCVTWRGMTSSPILVASSTRQVSIWDLRSPHRGRSGSGSAARPCLRYAVGLGDGGGSSGGDYSPLVHVACDEYSHQVAVMDSAGVLRVYDDRRAGGAGGGGGSVPLGTFSAHSRSGAGVASLRNGASPPCWITWGRDDDNRGGTNTAVAGCVKLWRDSTGASITRSGGPGDIDPDSYWYMGEETAGDEGQRNGSESSSSCSYDLLAVLGGRGDDGVSSYYCARVCPGPFGDVILTIGPPSRPPAETFGDDGTAAAVKAGAGASSGWQAELWSVDCDSSAGTGPGDGDCCRRVASFRGGGTDDEALAEMIGADKVRGAGSHLLGVDLAVGPSPLASASNGGGACELQVCCLNSNGYLTTHAVPEASSFNRSVDSSETQPSSMGMNAAASSAATPGSPTSSPTRIAAQQVQQQQQHQIHIRPIHQPLAGQNSRPGGKVFRHHSSADETSWGTDDGTFARPHATAVLTPRDRASATLDGSPKSGAARDVIFSQNYAHRVEDPSGTDHQHAKKSPLSWSALPPAASPDLRPLDGGVAVAAAATAADPIAAAVARGLEGGMMQFDLDGPAPTSSGAPAPFSSSSGDATRGDEVAGAKATPDGGLLPSPILSSIQVKAQSGTAAANEDDPQQKRRTTSTDAAIAVRMPCPRLCGATFGGGGGGGIILFHNGEVSKTWSWFRRNYNTSPQKQQSDHGVSTPSNEIHASSLGIRARDAIVSDAHSKIVVGDGRSTANDNSSHRVRAFSETPRTMLDLIKMNAAAKIAQWGDDADANRDSGDDDDSDSVLDSLSDDEEAEDEAESDENLNEQSSKQYDLDRLYNSHPSKSSYVLASDGDLSLSSQKRESVGKIQSIGRRYRDERHTDPFAGPSTDPLAPAVIFTNFYSKVVLNGQCPELAEGFKLGDWWLTREGDIPSSCLSDPNRRRVDQVKNEGGIYDENGWGWGYDDHGDTSQNAGYRTLFPLSARGSRESIHSAVESTPVALPRNQSVPILPYLAPSRSSRGISATEHGGADGNPLVRNNSMMNNLKRLFSHQKQGTLTPPDQSFSDLSDVRKSNSATDIRHAPPGIRRSSSTSALLQNKTTNESYRPYDKELQVYDVSQNDVGVHYKMKVSDIRRSELISRQIRRTRSICLHNASVCKHVGQPDKGQVWELLAQVVENIVTNIDCHDGWRDDGGDALGNDLVSNVLRYFEACGDVQMLATIVCVLCGGEDRRKINEGTNDSSPTGRGVQGLLPADDDRYDKYMHTYSSLLYCWGLLNERTELGKHLASSVPGAGGETICPTFQSGLGSRSAGRTKVVVPNHGIAPGIWFAPLCPRCNRPAKAETNICTTCKDYAFRCSICTNAVRGQFTVCFSCGHGGHVDHILAWFDQHTLCPSGCGCSCVFNAVGPMENELTLSEAKAPQFGNVLHQSVATTDSFFSGYVGSVPFGAYDSQKGASSGAGRKSRRSNVVDSSITSATTLYLKSSSRSSKQSYRKRFSRRVSDKL